MSDHYEGTAERDARELEGGGDEQTWGQGEGRHEPTIPNDEDEPTTYSGGTERELTDEQMPRSTEDEGKDR